MRLALDLDFDCDSEAALQLHCAMARPGSDYFIVKVSSICSKKRFTSNLSRDTSYYAIHRRVKKKL